MTLELLLDDRRVSVPPVVLPQLPGAGVEPLAAALLAAAGGGLRRVLPDPGSGASPAAVRGWHRDLWWAMREAERRSVVLATGPGAACLGPLLDGEAQVVVFVRDPFDAVASLVDAALP